MQTGSRTFRKSVTMPSASTIGEDRKSSAELFTYNHFVVLNLLLRWLI